jgi:hypothetical protein
VIWENRGQIKCNWLKSEKLKHVTILLRMIRPAQVSCSGRVLGVLKRVDWAEGDPRVISVWARAASLLTPCSSQEIENWFIIPWNPAFWKRDGLSPIFGSFFDEFASFEYCSFEVYSRCYVGYHSHVYIWETNSSMGGQEQYPLTNLAFVSRILIFQTLVVCQFYFRIEKT